MIKKGKYRHFKGNVYEVVGEAKHSETLECLVLYKDEKGKIWARPEKMFLENVELNGKIVPRFKYLA
ncbi:MAG: hypothetical protein A2365_03420 [Candidatus Nealsonbacteria bacterium RIFOXYB1_FULL_40_15]|uniref:DUF1653 domain-containing protein n=2 Tax=Candidatus Nealsoniibacteriota TaxID=1817911 RepID=A0A1G2ERJ9_9BACT|nr:MAG: hypothetical protein A2365_03420 [Candidatus Nealsonbacteria bacterium RIFOXYB1_FULL_40_15]OGZ28399.1 MAG: hypothetical protein A2427_01100 [Candidatus Nealsonbacteria bacterium RIFOXYC1_FULL_40_7]OGZ29568.1 MAG: hypothetical protein A2562_02195 [Candidatus Nealsonbacteria bacterium RIFOXYD1_FULL_39_11]